MELNLIKYKVVLPIIGKKAKRTPAKPLFMGIYKNKQLSGVRCVRVGKVKRTPAKPVFMGIYKI